MDIILLCTLYLATTGASSTSLAQQQSDSLSYPYLQEIEVDQNHGGQKIDYSLGPGDRQIQFLEELHDGEKSAFINAPSSDAFSRPAVNKHVLHGRPAGTPDEPLSNVYWAGQQHAPVPERRVLLPYTGILTDGETWYTPEQAEEVREERKEAVYNGAGITYDSPSGIGQDGRLSQRMHSNEGYMSENKKSNSEDLQGNQHNYFYDHDETTEVPIPDSDISKTPRTNFPKRPESDPDTGQRYDYRNRLDNDVYYSSPEDATETPTSDSNSVTQTDSPSESDDSDDDEREDSDSILSSLKNAFVRSMRGLSNPFMRGTALISNPQIDEVVTAGVAIDMDPNMSTEDGTTGIVSSSGPLSHSFSEVNHGQITSHPLQPFTSQNSTVSNTTSSARIPTDTSVLSDTSSAPASSSAPPEITVSSRGPASPNSNSITYHDLSAMGGGTENQRSTAEASMQQARFDREISNADPSPRISSNQPRSRTVIAVNAAGVPQVRRCHFLASLLCASFAVL
jgi:hypothetical protein